MHSFLTWNRWLCIVSKPEHSLKTGGIKGAVIVILCEKTKPGQDLLFYFLFLMSPDLIKNNQFIEIAKYSCVLPQKYREYFLMDHLSQNQTFTLTSIKLHTEF